ncbi:MAG: RNA methyltransferase [Chloroflexota bacterium]|nr:RNA methyltransferase [Chloroflexota bacterium]
MIDPITSAANPRIKQFRSLLANRKERRRERLFVIEGVRLVEEALRTGATLTTVLFDPEQLSTTERGAALLATVRDRRGAFVATAEVIAAATDTVTPQGIVAIAAWPEVQPQGVGIQLVLDAVQDPGNVGTLLRSAEATGVTDVVCISGTADLYSPKVVRAAMGAHFRLAMRQDLHWEEVDDALGPADNIYVADAEGRMPYYAADWRQPSVLIIGNEANGIGPEARARATKVISIPMATSVESLNAAVAGSVILFEAARQRRLGRS